jgi:glycosyltransferase involved in cell wall biosynthesis
MEITVLTPVHNGERYLREALDSVLAQTHADFELLVVDDGSTDATPAILQQYASDPRVKLLRIPKGGISRALNHGLNAATGRWIARFDADDVMLPHRLERQLHFLQSHPELAGADSFFETMDSSGRCYARAESPLTTPEAALRRLDNNEDVIFCHGSMMYGREMALETGAYRPGFDCCEDVDLFVRMIRSGRLLIVQPEFLVRVRVHAQSTSGRSTERQFHLNSLIRENYFRYRSGRPDLSPEFYFQRLQGSPLRRGASALGWRAEAFIRRMNEHKRRGQLLRGAMSAVAACLLSPPRALRKLLSGYESVARGAARQRRAEGGG